jgi:cellulose biosynthesis protein BcsQ
MGDAGGLLSSILGQVDERIRPVVEFGILAILAGAAVATALNPILEFLHKIWRFFRWLGRSTRSQLQKLFGRAAPPPPPPEPGRVIPEEKTIWEARAPSQPTFPKSSGIPIITIANMKGGVGKTTIAANLALYFRDQIKKPVLLIDFDYQGSLSQSIRGEAGYTDLDLTADILISSPSPSPDPILFAREMRRDLENIFIYTANYPFATIENNLMADWMQSGNGELMYRLCNLLRQPSFQDKFGAILIDCPPRLTTGSINGLCASTHLLVPTTLDDMSAQAAQYFLTQVDRMGQTVFPKLKVIGIVPSIVYGSGDTLIGEKRTHDRLKEYGKSVWKRDDFVLSSGSIPRTADISNYAGNGVAYVRKAKARQIFERLGKEVEKRL